jgi:ribonuclease HI
MIKIYTDGSCLENPGNGGWAAIIFINDEKVVITGNKKNTTNNQMELMAAIESLKKIPEGQEVEIFTDSQYVKQGITDWIEKWIQNNWKTSSKQKVKNVELWKELNIVSKKHKIKWNWVKAHAGDVFNEEVDGLAKKAANKSKLIF